jgi:hypothetical protein
MPQQQACQSLNTTAHAALVWPRPKTGGAARQVPPVPPRAQHMRRRSTPTPPSSHLHSREQHAQRRHLVPLDTPSVNATARSRMQVVHRKGPQGRLQRPSKRCPPSVSIALCQSRAIIFFLRTTEALLCLPSEATAPIGCPHVTAATAPAKPRLAPQVAESPSPTYPASRWTAPHIRALLEGSQPSHLPSLRMDATYPSARMSMIGARSITTPSRNPSPAAI